MSLTSNDRWRECLSMLNDAEIAELDKVITSGLSHFCEGRRKEAPPCGTHILDTLSEMMSVAEGVRDEIMWRAASRAPVPGRTPG